MRPPTVNVTEIAFDKQLTTLTMSDRDGPTSRWNIENGSNVSELSMKIDRNGNKCLSETGSYLALTTPDGRIEIWCVSSGTRIPQLTNIKTLPSRMCFFDNDQSLIGLVMQPDKKVIEAAIWDVATGSLRYESALVCPVNLDTTVVMHPSEEIIAISAPDDLRVYSLPIGQLLATLPEGGWKVIHFDSSGEFIMCGTSGGTVILWDWRNEAVLQRFLGHYGMVYAVALSPDGKTLATGDKQGAVRLWEPKSGQEMIKLPATTNTVISLLKFSSDGQRLGCVNRADTIQARCDVRVWSIERPVP
jgi:WD40 repeat protein